MVIISAGCVSTTPQSYTKSIVYQLSLLMYAVGSTVIVEIPFNLKQNVSSD